MDIPLLAARQAWACPNCPAVHVTSAVAPHVPFHPCPGLAGILAPYVRAGTACKVEAAAWEDYTGGHSGVRRDAGGRPVSAVITTRDDGQDCAVYPGCAAGTGTI